MVGCCAVGCKNRTEQGYIMKVFPRDPTRRKEWAVKVRRENWTPSNSSYLCEVTVHYKRVMCYVVIFYQPFKFESSTSQVSSILFC